MQFPRLSAAGVFFPGLVIIALTGCNRSIPKETANDQTSAPSTTAAVSVTNRAATMDSSGSLRDWHQFRGPGGMAISRAPNIPTRWADDSEIAWKTKLDGAGASSPVIYGDRVFLTWYTGYGVQPNQPGTMSDLKRHVGAFRLSDGKPLWQTDITSVLPETDYRKRMQLHGYASSTPVVDADRVYCFFGKSGVVALDHDGNEVWKTPVGNKTHGWGSASSPILCGDLVIVNACPVSDSLVALDRKTGHEIWRKQVLKETWSTPLIVTLADGRQEIVVASFDKILGFDPKDGNTRWSCEGMGWYSVASMVANQDVVYCMTGKGVEQTLAVRAGGQGDVTDTHVLWRARKGSNVSSPVYFEGHLYFAHESLAIAYCLDATNGQIRYEQRLPRVGMIYASPIIADGKLYYVSRDRGTVVLAAKPEYELLAHNRLQQDASVFNASPAVSGSGLLLRSNRYLYCIGKP